jgi:hypothetical protein
MTEQDGNRILEIVRAESRFLRRRRLMLVLVQAALVFAVPVLAFVAVDRLYPLQESLAMKLCGAWAVVGAVFLLTRLVAIMRDGISANTITLAVEDDCPELMDSLVCAVELLENDKPPTALGSELIRQVEEQLQAGRVHDAIRKRTLATGALAALILGAAGALYVGHFSELGVKARAHLSDALNKTSTGLTISPGEIEIAEGDDLNLRAVINRGPQNASITITDSRGTNTFEMYADGTADRYFDVFSIGESFTYKVTTPTLKSAVYRVTTFKKPAITASTITVEPPAYTKSASKSFDELKDIAAPAGSTVRISLAANMPVTATLVAEEGEQQVFQPADSSDNSYILELQVSASIRYKIALEDRYDHRIETNQQYAIEAIEDFAPLIQVMKPKENEKFRPDDTAVFAAKVTDEYGIGSVDLIYSINGGRWITTNLYTAAADSAEQLLNPNHSFDLDGIVDPGDIVSYYFKAADNAEPEPNVSQSDLRFIEIRPDMEEQPESDEEGMEMKSADVADLLMEQKLLSTTTHKFSQKELDDQTRAEELADLQRRLGDLRVATQKRYTDLQNALGGASAGIVEELFEKVLDNMRVAEERMQKDLPEESLSAQTKSQNNLVKLEIELAKNAQKGKGKGESKSQEQKEQERQLAELNEEKEQREKLDQLDRHLEKLDDLSAQQQNLNADMERAGNDADEDYRRFLKKKQEQIRQQAEDLEREMASMPEAFPSRRELRSAQENMRNNEQRLDQGQMTNAQKFGELAEQHLQRSRELTQQMRDGMTSSAVQQAGRALQQLQQNQQQLRQETAQAAGEGKPDTKQLKDKQEQLRRDLEDVMDKLGKAAQELEEDNPEAANTLGEAMRQAQQQKIDSNMKRAENALRYKKLDRAQDYQQKAEQALAQMSEQVGKAMQQSPGVGAEQLTQMLGETLQDLENAQQAGEQGKDAQQQAGEQASGNLSENAEASGDEELQKLADHLQEVTSKAAQSGGSAADGRVEAVLMKAAQRLETMLIEKAIERKLDLTRVAGQQAPDEYRKLVREYFKNLSKIK